MWNPVPVRMEAEGSVLSAARAVLELLEREWQPLSPGELELRLDQAVEESLEAELVSSLQDQVPAAASWSLKTELLGRSLPAAVEDQEGLQLIGGAAVQVLSQVLFLTRMIG